MESVNTVQSLTRSQGHPTRPTKPQHEKESTTPVEALVEEYKAAKQHELRFDKKKALLEHLVGAVEACAANKF